MNRERALIIARCYADEPVLLEVRGVTPVGDRGRYVLTVARPSAETTIGWNPEYAFAYGEELYAELRAAYDAGDTQRLAGLWTTARRVAYTVASRRASVLVVDPTPEQAGPS